MTTSDIVFELIRSARRGALDDVRQLVEEHGADVMAKSEVDGWTALHGAVMKGQANVVSYLVGRGADPQAQGHDGITPFIVAAQNKAYDLLALMLRPRRIRVPVVVPVPSVESEKEEEDGSGCSICFAEGEDVKMHRVIACGHRFCVVCLGRWFTTQISEGFAVVVCPHPKCRTSICSEDVKACVQEAEILDKFERNITGLALSTMPDFRWCPRCENGGFVPLHCEAVTCDACQKVFCADCTMDSHPGMDCESYARQVVEGRIVVDGSVRVQVNMVREWRSKEWKGRNTKRCPQCDVPIEKYGGCPYMQCSRCRHEFCWVCMKNYSGDQYDRHASCRARYPHYFADIVAI